MSHGPRGGFFSFDSQTKIISMSLRHAVRKHLTFTVDKSFQELFTQDESLCNCHHRHERDNHTWLRKNSEKEWKGATQTVTASPLMACPLCIRTAFLQSSSAPTIQNKKMLVKVDLRLNFFFSSIFTLQNEWSPVMETCPGLSTLKLLCVSWTLVDTDSSFTLSLVL